MGQEKTRDTLTLTLSSDTSQCSGTRDIRHDKPKETHIMGQDIRHLTLDTLTMTLSRDTFNTVTQEIWDKTRDKTHIMGQERLETHHTPTHHTQQIHIAYSDTWETYCGIHIMGHDKTKDTYYWIWQDTRDTYHGTLQETHIMEHDKQRHAHQRRHHIEEWSSEQLQDMTSDKGQEKGVKRVRYNILSMERIADEKSATCQNVQ